MTKQNLFAILITLTLSMLLLLSSGVQASSVTHSLKTTSPQTVELSKVRAARIQRGINLSHWFSQSATFSKAHLQTHTTVADIALIKRMGFDHVRLPLEPAPLFTDGEPDRLKTEYLSYVDDALTQILAQGLAVIVDIHPGDEFKIRLNKDDRHVEAFAKFWRALATHLSSRDPERVFLEVINEPMVEDGYRWFGIQGKLIDSIRAAAPRHTIIASGHRWSGPYELLFLAPYADQNIIYNFHFYEPFAFTHQGATWAGPNLPFYKEVPYPSTPEGVMKIMETVHDAPARYNLLRYGEDRWNLARLDREIGMIASWAEKHRVPLTCNEFGAFRRFSRPSDRATWIVDLRTVLEKHGIGWTMWDYAGGFAVVNKSNGVATPDAEVIKALGLVVK